MKVIHSSLLLIYLFLPTCRLSGAEKTDKEESNSSSKEPIEQTVATGELTQIAIFSKHTNYDNNLSTIAADIKFIALDIEPPINDFLTSDIALSDDYIFLLSPKQVIQYDKNGKYIRKIGTYGQGPKEYINPHTPLQLDHKNKLIYISDINLKKIIIFNFKGEYQKTIPLKVASSIMLIDENTIALPQDSEDMVSASPSSIRFMDYNGNITKSYPSSIHPVKLPPGEKMRWGSGVSYLWEYKNNFYYLEYGNDTIFKILQNSILPISILTGEEKLKREEHFYNGNQKKFKIISSIARANAAIFESDQFIIFKLMNKGETFYNVYNKLTNKFHRTFYPDILPNRLGNKKMDFFRDNIVSGLSFSPQYQSYEKALALIPAEEIVEKRKEILDFIAKNPTKEGENLKAILKNIDEEDNPIIMVVTLK